MAETDHIRAGLPSGILSKPVAVRPEFDHAVWHARSREDIASAIGSDERVNVLCVVFALRRKSDEAEGGDGAGKYSFEHIHVIY